MNLGKLIQYNLRNIFLEKLYTKCGAETIRLRTKWLWFRIPLQSLFPRTVSKKSKLSISLNQYSKVLYVLFLFAKLKTIEIN